MNGDCYAASRMFDLTFSINSGVICRIPCTFACSAAFWSTSASVAPRTTWLQPLDGSTFAHSTILAISFLSGRSFERSFEQYVTFSARRCTSDKNWESRIERFVTSRRIPPAAAGEGRSIVDIQGRIEDPPGCETLGVAMHGPSPSIFCQLPKTHAERRLPEDDADDEQEITFAAESSSIRTNSQQTPGEERGCTCRRESLR